MIGYVTLGTKDLKKAAAFYDKIAAEMGIGVSWRHAYCLGSADGSAGLGADPLTASRCRWEMA